MQAVFGGEEVAQVLGRERMELPEDPVLGRKARERLLDLGQEMLKTGKIPASPYEA